jgi:heme-degrading monooxygenase HmoA
MTNVHLAQINIGRMKGPLDGPIMAGFMARLDDLNALAESSPGFVWRMQGEEGNNTYLRPYEDERIIVNMSVWESIDALRAYVYNSAHAEILKQRRDWFEKFESAMLALWWIPAGHIPTVEEAKQRLASLDAIGPTPFAFTFRTTFPPSPVELPAAEVG